MEIRSVDGLPIETDPLIGEPGVVKRAIFFAMEKILQLLNTFR